ncbi:MAG: hypothetical protein QM831_31030 [Kofleriaceae bacterium]
MGVDRIGKFNFLYNEGGPAYDKALAAYKKKDWAAVRTNCETAVGKDPQHFDAQRLLAVALTQQGEHAAAVDHIVAAIAGDYFKYGAAFATDPELDEFRKTPHGQAVTALAQQIHDEWQRRVKTGIWVIGRRSTFKWPAKDGVQYATSRGEVYAYDRESKRYFRLTHTDYQVAGYVRGTQELVVLGFDKVDHPAKDDSPPLIARPYVWLFDPTEWKPLGKKIELPSARAVAVGYGDGEQLLVGEAQATGRWSIGDWAVSNVEKSSAGKLTKVNQALPKLRVELTLDDARSTRDITGVDATWVNDTAPQLKVGTTTIQVPESHAAAMDSVSLSPDKLHLAFATAIESMHAECGAVDLRRRYEDRRREAHPHAEVALRHAVARCDHVRVRRRRRRDPVVGYVDHARGDEARGQGRARARRALADRADVQDRPCAANRIRIRRATSGRAAPVTEVDEALRPKKREP